MTASSVNRRPLVLVSVGTDHHPFDRLVDWVDRWAGDHPETDVLVQHGSAQPPTVANGARLLAHGELQDAMGRAQAVVCHGGPATITEARRHGHLPVCVPRDPLRGEHVDDHQLRFARFLDRQGMVQLATDEPQLRSLLEAALLGPGPGASPDRGDAPGPPGVARVGEVVQQLVAGRARSRAGAESAALTPVTVLYLGGQGRSGSTLIERAVGELDGFVNVGEVVHLWDRGLLGDELCGCGERFHHCSFWTAVGDRAFGGWDALDADAIVRLRFGVDRNRYLPLLLQPRLSRSYRERRDRYAELLGRLYRAIAEVSGARVVVDSSKHGSYALLLAGIPGIDLRILQVVRDSPAVAHAWGKAVVRPETDDQLMPTYTPAKAAFWWVGQNTLVELAGRQHPHHVVRYEDFVDCPKDTLLEVLRLVDEPDDPAALTFLDGDTLHLGPTHTVAGNPMRFTTGPVQIREDDAWQRAMPTRQQRLVAGLTAPLRRRYGYPGRTR